MLWKAYRALSHKQTSLPDTIPTLYKQEETRRFINSLDIADKGVREYFAIHLDRIAVTLGIVPLPHNTGRVLELGAYMHMTPALQHIHGFSEVTGAYFGPLGQSSKKQSTVEGKVIFQCTVDLFNAEKDRYPYKDQTFDCVLACEIFEHLLHDPMHMLAEANRILHPAGALVLTTPNAASATAVARTLTMSDNPQLYSKYTDPRHEYAESEVGHMREYTPGELTQALQAAGFKVEQLFTKLAPGYPAYKTILPLLQDLGYSTHLRGEQIFCLARKVSPPVDRYPAFLYE